MYINIKQRGHRYGLPVTLQVRTLVAVAAPFGGGTYALVVVDKVLAGCRGQAGFTGALVRIDLAVFSLVTRRTGATKGIEAHVR